MLKLEPIEIILRTIPEGFLYLLGVYIFSNQQIDKNRSKYIISSLVTGGIIYLFRALPITYGVHTMLTILFVIFWNTIYLKIDTINSIKGTIIVFLIQLLSEGMNIVILKLIPGINLEELFKTALYKNILGIPSLIISLLILLLAKSIIKKREKNDK